MKAFVVLSMTLPLGLGPMTDSGAQEEPKLDPPSEERFQQDLAWSPDGAHIAFTQYAPGAEGGGAGAWSVNVAAVDGGEVRQLVSDARNVSWSPDGSRLALASDRSGNWDVYTVASDGSDIARITNDDADDRGPAWSPDGRSIAFTSNRFGKRNVFLVELEGGETLRLTDTEADDLNPAWSPDGRWLVFYREKGDGMDQIHAVAADGSEEKQVTGDSANNTFPSFLPDGRVAFTSQLPGESHRLVIAKADGSERTTVTGASTFFGRFSPDGSTIAFIAGRWPRSAIYLTKPESAAFRKLVND
jgi:tol-pal system beta propeller repeat protein TolB